MRRCLHRFNQDLSGDTAFEAAEFLSSDDDYLVASVHGHMLRAFAADFADQFAEAGLGILEQPIS